MRILVYGINYYPEKIGIGKYSSEMAEWLAQQGNQVNVITAMPYYPDWKIMDSYRSKLWHSEAIKGVIVHRSPLYVPTRVTGLTRIVHEATFALSSLIYWGRFSFTKFDVVISIAPPLQTGIPVLIHKVIHKTIFIYHIQDLQLEAAKELGLIKNKFFLKIISSIEQIIFRRSDFVSTISEGMLRKLVTKNVPSEKLFVLRNWVDTNFIFPEAIDAGLRESFDIPISKKIVLYSGNIGEKQGLEILIEVAQSLETLDIIFLVIGEGSYKSKFEEIIKSSGIKNIKLFPLQSTELFNKVLNLANLHLVLQKRAAADLVMPSKLSAILAAGGVAIVTAEKGSNLYDLIKENELGIVVEPESSDALKDAIIGALSMDLTHYKRNARRYAQNYLDKEIIMTGLFNFISAKRI